MHSGSWIERQTKDVAASRPVTAMCGTIANGAGRTIRLRTEAASRSRTATLIPAARNRTVAHLKRRASVRAMVFCLWNRAAHAAPACLAVLLMLFMASCSSTSTDSGGLPRHLPDIQLAGSTDTPPHSMASYEYPFDTNGRYVTDWAAEGERRAGRAANATSADTSKWSRSHGTSGSRKSGSSSKVASSSKTGSKSKPGSSSPKVVVNNSKPVSSKSGSSTNSSSSPKVAANDDEPSGTSKPAVKRTSPSSDDSGPPKSSTTAKAKSSSKSGRSYKVKSGDTLSASPQTTEQASRRSSRRMA